MDLEKKVQILEQEIEILKNQIQATLLDIKEQMLTHTYPVLRADAPSPSQPVPTANVQQTIPVVMEPDHNATASDTPHIRKVSLTEISKSPVQQSQPAMGTAHHATAPALDWQTLQELEAWANNTVVEVGIQRTRELIKHYTENGQFTPAMHDTLLDMISISQRSKAPNRITMPSVLPVQPPVETASEPKKRPANGQQPKTQSSKHNTVKQPSASQKSETKRQQAPRQTKPASKRPLENTNEAEPETKNNVVLRLIAGIQNAGVGVKWKRKNG